MAVTRKDWTAEWRTRYALTTSLAFSIIALSVVSFSVGSLRREPPLAAGLLWVILFFAAIVALGRTFTKEEDAHTADLLRLTVPPTALFFGKMIFNLSLLALIALITVPLFVALMGLPIREWPQLALAVSLTLTVMASLGTLLGAMLTRAQSRFALLGVAGFPLFFPALSAAVRTTLLTFNPNPSESLSPLPFLFAYALASLLAGLLLFEEIW